MWRSTGTLSFYSDNVWKLIDFINDIVDTKSNNLYLNNGNI